VDLFKRQADSGQDQELKQFAQQTLPTLQHHLDEAHRIQSAMSQQAGADVGTVEPAAGDSSTQQAARSDNALTQMTADQLIGQSVVNNKGDKVGKIEDIVLDKDKAVLAVLSVGGFLGIGDKDVAVPFDQLQPGENKTILLSGATEDQLKSMPAYEKGTTGYEAYPRNQAVGGNP
jgi:putative membrane protein